MSNEKIVLEFADVAIAYGNGPMLVSDVSLRLMSGQMVCLTGPSGCGKTSLLGAALGLTPLCAGSVKVCGTLLTPQTIDWIRKQTSWIPQELSLPVEWVSEMVRLLFALKANRATPFSEAKLRDSFRLLDLEDGLLAKRVNEISGGQRQRISLAVAAMLQKPLMLIDEPTSALDQGTTGLVIDFLRQYVARGGAVLAVSHDAGFAAGCDFVFHFPQASEQSSG